MPKYFVRALKPEGFWRGGLFFTYEGREIDTDELSEKQVALIMGEKRMLLAIKVVQCEPEPEKGEKEIPGRDKVKPEKNEKESPGHDKAKPEKGK